MNSLQPNYKTLVIKNGDAAILPKGATIVSVGIRGDVSATSNCQDIQDLIDNAADYACYRFSIACADDDSGAAYVLDIESAKITDLYVAGQQYPIDWKIADVDSSDFPTTFKVKVPEAICQIYHRGWREDYDHRREYQIYVKMLPAMAKATKLRLTGVGFWDGLYIEPRAVDCNTNAEI